MSKEHGGVKRGPILSPQEDGMVPPVHDGHDATGKGIYNSVPGYPAGTKDIIQQLIFDQSGGLGDIKPAKE